MNNVTIYLKDGLFFNFETSNTEADIINAFKTNGYLSVPITETLEDGTTVNKTRILFDVSVKYIDIK